VQSTTTFDDALDRLGHRGLVSNVERGQIDAAAIFDNLGRDPLELVALAADDRDVGPERGELVGDAATDAAAPAGDEDRLVGQKSGSEDGAIRRRQGGRTVSDAPIRGARRC